MRLAISSVAAGKKGAAASMAAFVRAVYEGFHVLPMVAELRRDLAKKLEVMRSSLVKIETGKAWSGILYSLVLPSSMCSFCCCT